MNTNKKPELVVTAKNINELKQLIDAGADAILIGSEKYGLRLPGDFSLDMIKEATVLAHEKQAKIYVVMNALLHNDAIVDLDNYVQNLANSQVDGIVFGDPAVLATVRDIDPSIPLHWNTETTSTNFETVNYWASKGAARAILARELSLQEVIDIKQNTEIEVQAQIHGMTCIFHSKRSLLENYFDHLGKEEVMDVTKEKGFFLREHKRPGEKYPIYQDEHGTHIMSSQDICMVGHLKEFINAGIDSLKIEGLMQKTDYLVKVTAIYREAIDKIVNNDAIVGLEEQIEAIQPTNRPLATGFYFKEQIY